MPLQPNTPARCFLAALPCFITMLKSSYLYLCPSQCVFRPRVLPLAVYNDIIAAPLFVEVVVPYFIEYRYCTSPWLLSGLHALKEVAMGVFALS